LQGEWTGKANAIWTAIPHVRSQWLLFTDADTVHQPTTLKNSIQEALQYQVDLLSYSPEQLAHAFTEKALQSVIFGELSRVFSYDRINDPKNPDAAANGQFILIKREMYDRIGGHAAVHTSLLEDVDLAKLVKKTGKLRFRYAPEAVRTRMYSSFSQMAEGWTKNLAVLFTNTFSLSILRMSEFLIAALAPIMGIILLVSGSRKSALITFAIWLFILGLFSRRIRGAGFPLKAIPISIFGLPIFSYLLLKSYYSYYHRHKISWKGRTYDHVR